MIGYFFFLGAVREKVEVGQVIKYSLFSAAVIAGIENTATWQLQAK